MYSCSFYILVGLVSLISAIVIEKQAIPNNSNKNDLKKKPFENQLIFYRFNYFKLARFLTEQKLVASLKQRENEIKTLKIKEERENEIYKKKLASRVKSSFLRDFVTLRY